MKRVTLCLLTIGLSFAVLSPLLMAQTTPPPPPCCPRSPGVAPDDGASKLPVSQMQLTVPVEWLQTQGMSRVQFLDRIAQMMFPGDQVDFVLAWKQEMSPSSNPAKAARDLPVLIAIQETYIYRIPRSGLKPEQLETLGECSMTNGSASIQVKFSAAEASPAGSTTRLVPAP